MFVFLFKQKTAYEIRLSLVGSEMCIRDRIASLSLGEEREIVFKNKNENISLKIPQLHGQLLVMHGSTQEYWKHEIKKTKKLKKPRINLTFRNIISH